MNAPKFAVDDIVVSFRDEVGKVARVYPSDAPHRSHRVEVAWWNETTSQFSDHDSVAYYESVFEACDDAAYRGIEEDHYVGVCPACGNPIDYCQGHGEIGDPEGFSILEDHSLGDNHSRCHPEAECE